MYAGTKGSTQGETNEMKPAKKAGARPMSMSDSLLRFVVKGAHLLSKRPITPDKTNNDADNNDQGERIACD